MYKVKSNWAIKQFGNEIILLELSGEIKYYLNEHSSFILSEAILNIDFKDRIIQKYDKSERDVVLCDINEFIGNLISLGVLENNV